MGVSDSDIFGCEPLLNFQNLLFKNSEILKSLSVKRISIILIGFLIIIYFNMDKKLWRYLLFPIITKNIAADPEKRSVTKLILNRIAAQRQRRQRES